MMGRQSGQISMLVLDIEELIPENHLLRRINQLVSFNFIYDLVAPYYSANGRPSVDPVSMFKMLLVGYLYGIKSERRLVQEVQLNIAYRWFCGFELGEKIPDHSTFSKTRVRKWNESDFFQQAFLEIVRRCIEQKLIDGKEMASDGSYIPAEVSRNSWIDVELEVEQSMLSYLDDLDQELASQPGFKKPPTRTATKKITTSTTDPECGYIHHGSKRGVGYLMEATVDCKHGIITGVDVFPANEKESLLVLRHLERQKKQLGLSMEKVALDRGYDTGAVHRGLELLGITGYIPAIRFPNDPSKYGFSYDPQQDTFICPMGQSLVYHRLNCNKSTGKYLRCYQVQGDVCQKCTSRKTCFDTTGVRRRILASSCYPAFYRGHLRVNTPEYLYMMRKRKIWAEGSFAAMKREHNLLKIRKRGILAATEECLLSAMALNLKRMVKAIFFAMLMDKIWAENMIPQPIFRLCQQVLQFTPPRGGDAVVATTAAAADDFNSRPRVGATWSSRFPTLPAYFNSRPRMGATSKRKVFVPPTVISIHAPAWGRPVKYEMDNGDIVFQFTPPRGGDRGVVCEIIDKGLFQFTPPRGGDVFTAVYGLSGDISIHAPAWGRRHGLSNARSIKEFQFTPPRGGDRCWDSLSAYSRYFNSRPRVGATLMRFSSPVRSNYFNSRPRVGATDLQYYEGREEDISIHAPAWGRPKR